MIKASKKPTNLSVENVAGSQASNVVGFYLIMLHISGRLRFLASPDMTGGGFCGSAARRNNFVYRSMFDVKSFSSVYLSSANFRS